MGLSMLIALKKTIQKQISQRGYNRNFIQIANISEFSKWAVDLDVLMD